MNKPKRKKIIIISLVTIVLVALLGLFLYKDENGKSLNFVTKIKEFLVGSGTEENRVKYNFNYDWKFAIGEGTYNNNSVYNRYCKINDSTDCVEATSLPDATYQLNEVVNNVLTTEQVFNNTFNANTDHRFETVSLPHTFNDIDTFNNYMETGMNGERSMYTGTAWYKKEFVLDASYEGKRIIIEFEAARQAAKVWINGVLQEGLYQNGFLAFGYDITDDVTYGIDNPNTITVMVDNTQDYKIYDTELGQTNTVIPWHDSHWHPNYGGLYRNSFLYVVDDLHLTLPLYSFTEGSGTYVYTTNEGTNVATINIDAEVENSDIISRTFSYRALIKNASGNTILTINSPSTVTLSAGEKDVYHMSGIITNPNLYSDDYPYLYTANVELVEIIDGNEVVVDSNANNFGIRTYRFTSDYGFYLNENYTILNGWGQKTTMEWAGIGAAYPNWMQDYVIKMMKDAGSNYLRWGHVSGTQTQTDITDKYGILVLMPGLDGEGNSAGSQSYETAAYKLRIEAMRDMIISMRNHPSIIMWEMGNQATGLTTILSSSNVESIAGLDYSGDRSVVSILEDVINDYDYGNRSSVIRNAGEYNNTESTSDRLISIRQGSAEIADYIDVGETTQGISNIYSTKPAIEGEYNRLEARRGLWDNYTNSSFNNYTHETTTQYEREYSKITVESASTAEVGKFKTVMDATATVGGANWIFSDSISHGRIYSEVARATGEVDAVMLPKDSYYVDSVIFNKTPGIHIIGHWNYPIGTVKKVYVVAKGATRVELFLNGNSLGNGVLSNTYLYTFNNVTWQTGTLLAIGYNSEGTEIFRDSITSHGEPSSIKITPIERENGAKANASDIVLFDVELIDNMGNRCSSYDGQFSNEDVVFTLNATNNSATWIGGYNSNTPENTRSNTLYLEAGITRVAAKTTLNAGTITLTASTSVNSVPMSATSSSVSTENIENTNGLSNFSEETPVYSLNNNNNKGYGSGAKYGIELTNVLATNSLLLSNITYGGTEKSSNAVIDGFSKGTNLYSDHSDVVTEMPYKYINAEMFRLPYSDRGLVNSNYLSFTVNRDVDVMIMVDSSMSSIDYPTWLTTGYVDTGDNIVSNDTVYNLFKSINSVASGSTVTIGGNSDIAEIGANYHMNIVLVKETSKVANHIFFEEDFNDISQNAVNSGFNSIVGANSSISREIVDGRTALKYYDNSAYNNATATNGDISYTTKQFAMLDRPFSIEFKAYVTDTMNNTYLRFYLSNGGFTEGSTSEYADRIWLRNTSDIIPVAGTFAGVVPLAHDYRERIALDYYLFRGNSGEGNFLEIKSKDNTSSSSQISVLNTGQRLNTWHSYKLDIDPVNQIYTTYVYNESSGEYEPGNGDELAAIDRPFTAKTYIENGVTKTLNSLDTLIIGTGRNFTSEFYVDDIKIIPKMDMGASAIVVNGRTINLYEGMENYLVTGTITPDESTFSLVTTDDYYSHEIDTTTYNNKAVVTIINQNLEETTFNINFSSSAIFDGYTIFPSTNATVTADTMGSDEVMHFLDTSTTEKVFVEKSFTPIDSAIKFSYDIYLTGNQNNIDIRTLITSNPLGIDYDDVSNSDKLGVNMFLTPITATSDESFKYTTSLTTVANDTIISQNEWHTIDYYVDLQNQSYIVTLDGINVYDEPIPFYGDTPITSFNNIVLGTDSIGTADFYLKNITTSEYSYAPIEAVYVDGKEISNFDKNSSNNIYYTDTELTSSSVITVDSNVFFDSFTSSINTTDKIITINVLNNLGDTVTYTISYDTVANRPITTAELEELIAQATTEYNRVDITYSPYTLNILHDCLISANGVLDDPLSQPREYAVEYFKLENAINNLKELLIYENEEYEELNGTVAYTEYATGLVSTIKYTDNILNKFDFVKVLENNINIYKNNNTLMFESVPYRFMNAEYVLISNDIHNNASLQFKALRDLYILVMRDWDAGPFTENGFVDTKEISLGTDGTVYKIFSKSISKGGIINLDFDTYINNKWTNKNNLVAFISADNYSNNNFFYEDFDHYYQIDDNYTSTQLLERSWAMILSARSGTNNNVNITGTTLARYSLDESLQATVTDGVCSGCSAYLETTTPNSGQTANQYAFPVMYKQFAKLGKVGDSTIFNSANQIELNFKMYTDNTLGANTFIRTWLTNGLAGVTGSDIDKSFALADFYIQDTSLAYKTSPSASSTTTVNSGVSIRTFNTYKVVFNLYTQKFSVYVNGSTTPKINNASFYNNDTSKTVKVNEINYPVNFNRIYATDHVYFSGRNTGSTHAWVRDIVVIPYTLDMYAGINIDGMGIGKKLVTDTSLYQDLTKAYVHKIATPTSNKELSLVAGSLANVATTIDYDVKDGNSLPISETTYGTVSGLVTDTYSRDYKVYYEVDENNAKADLVNLIKFAESKSKYLYTTSSWENLENQIALSKELLANQNATEAEVVAQTGDINAVNRPTGNLAEAILNLDLLSDSQFNYQGKKVAGKDYGNTFVDSAVNITNYSSLSANFALESRLSGSYNNAGKVHTRYLVTDTKFPANTKITLVNHSFENPEYYSYIVTQTDYTNNITSYDLYDFIKDGTTDGYFDMNYNLNGDIMSSDFTFIIDFENSVIEMPAGNHNLKVETFVEGIKLSTSEEINYTLYDTEIPITIGLGFNNEMYYTDSDFGITANIHVGTMIVNDILVSDTTIIDKIAGLKITLLDDNLNQIPFPKGITINDELNTFVVDNDGVIRISRGVNIGSLVRNFVLTSAYHDLDVGTYYLKFDLLESFDGFNEGEILSSEITSFIIENVPHCSIEASVLNERYLIEYGINSDLDFQIETICHDITGEQNITVSLYKKSNNILGDFTYDIMDYITYVDSSIATPYSENVYKIKSRNNVNQSRTEFIDTFQAHFNSNLSKGSYKMAFDIRAGNKVQTDEFTFVVK